MQVVLVYLHTDGQTDAQAMAKMREAFCYRA